MRLWQMIYEIYSVGRLIDMTHEMTWYDMRDQEYGAIIIGVWSDVVRME